MPTMVKSARLRIVRNNMTGELKYVTDEEYNKLKIVNKDGEPGKLKPGELKKLNQSRDDLSDADMKKWLSAGGLGIGSYMLSSYLFDELTEGKKGAWKNLLSVLVPLGVGGLGAWGGYELANSLQKKAQSTEAQLNGGNGENGADNDTFTEILDPDVRREMAENLPIAGPGARGALETAGGLAAGGNGLRDLYRLAWGGFPKQKDDSPYLREDVVAAPWLRDRYNDWVKEKNLQTQNEAYRRERDAAEAAFLTDAKNKYDEMKAKIEADNLTALKKYEADHAAWERAKAGWPAKQRELEQAWNENQDAKEKAWNENQDAQEKAYKESLSKQKRSETSGRRAFQKKRIGAVGEDLHGNMQNAIRQVIADAVADSNVKNMVSGVSALNNLSGLQKEPRTETRGYVRKPYAREPFPKQVFSEPEPQKPTPQEVPAYTNPKYKHPTPAPTNRTPDPTAAWKKFRTPYGVWGGAKTGLGGLLGYLGARDIANAWDNWKELREATADTQK